LAEEFEGWYGGQDFRVDDPSYRDGGESAECSYRSFEYAAFGFFEEVGSVGGFYCDGLCYFREGFPFLLCAERELAK
jgi:hypothetical protein